MYVKFNIKNVLPKILLIVHYKYRPAGKEKRGKWASQEFGALKIISLTKK